MLQVYRKSRQVWNYIRQLFHINVIIISEWYFQKYSVPQVVYLLPNVNYGGVEKLIFSGFNKFDNMHFLFFSFFRMIETDILWTQLWKLLQSWNLLLNKVIMSLINVIKTAWLNQQWHCITIFHERNLLRANIAVGTSHFYIHVIQRWVTRLLIGLSACICGKRRFWQSEPDALRDSLFCCDFALVIDASPVRH